MWRENGEDIYFMRTFLNIYLVVIHAVGDVCGLPTTSMFDRCKKWTQIMILSCHIIQITIKKNEV